MCMLILLTDGVKYPIRASKVDGFRTGRIVYRTGWLVARVDRLLGGMRREVVSKVSWNIGLGSDLGRPYWILHPVCK